uniref:MFS domain-containing protein n=1 Tax=Parastrongyloides trichosuri TaxID=131310 RepID=A0A0N4ZKY1_PARTI
MDECQTIDHSSLKELKIKEWIVVFILVFANAISLMVFSCITPFLIDVGNSKGVSLTMLGIVFAIFNFCGFITSPFAGRMISIFGVRSIYTLGMILLSIGTLLFSGTNLTTSGTWFFISTLTLRIIQSIGNTLMFTTTYAIAAQSFPKIMSALLGLTETGAGVGYTIGPTLGGILYQYIGYPYPFLILGITNSITTILAFYYIRTRTDYKNQESTSTTTTTAANTSTILLSESTKQEKVDLTWLKVIKIKDIWCMIFTLIIVGIVMSFHDSTLAIGCKQFNLSFGEVGLLFLCLGGSYAIFSPVWGHVLDKYHHINDYLFIAGYILQVIAYTCMGPASFLSFKPTVMTFGICLATIGFAASMMFVPSFKKSMDIILKEHLFAESLQTLSVISGLYASSYCLGAFLGPLLGSALVERKGHKEALSIVAFFCFCSAIIFSITYLIPRFKKKYQKKIRTLK